MKRIKYLFPLLAVMLAFSSCNKDILDKKPLDVITDLDVWKSAPLVKVYINNIYSRMDFTYIDQNSMGVVPWQVTEALYMDDTGGPGWGGVPKFGTLNAESSWLNWWGYNAIRDMNYALEKLPTANLDEAAKKSSIAEVRFLRAYSYFHMVKLFGGIPLITKAQGVNDPLGELFVPRAKEEEIYNFVIAELEAIATDLPVELPTADLGRPTKAAGLALKARAALYAGSIAQFGAMQLGGIVGIPADKSASFYQTSYTASKAIMDMSAATGKPALYTANANLVQNFKDIFLKSMNVEVILAKNMWAQAGFEGKAPVNLFGMTESPTDTHPWGAGHGTNCYLEFVSDFENADGTPGTINASTIPTGWVTTNELWGKKEPRFFASVYTENTDETVQVDQAFLPHTTHVYSKVLTSEGETLTSGTYKDINVNPGGGAGRAFGCRKYIKGNQWPTASDWILFRYAEVILNNAEAAFELGKTSEALADVNLIRARVKLPPLTAITRELIRHERRVELAFESLRYWDLRRWRTAKSLLNGKGTYHSLEMTLDYKTFDPKDPKTSKYKVVVIEADGGQTMVFGDKNYYLPIGPGRIANNSKLVENPGY